MREIFSQALGATRATASVMARDLLGSRAEDPLAERDPRFIRQTLPAYSRAARSFTTEVLRSVYSAGSVGTTYSLRFAAPAVLNSLIHTAPTAEPPILPREQQTVTAGVHSPGLDRATRRGRARPARAPREREQRLRTFHS